MATIGFIGLGLMGAPMAQNLIKAGHSLQLFSRSGVPCSLVCEAARECISAADAASNAAVIFIMVPDTQSVDAVLNGPEGLIDVLKPGQLVVDLSSIDPESTVSFGRQVSTTGSKFLDAPVSGGVVGAKAGQLSIMVGGPTDAFETALPILECLGKNITHVGGHGTGQVTKLANQIIVALNINAVAEAFTFAEKAGADPSRVRSALLGGFASSRVLELHGSRMIERDFEPGFRIGLHQKDLATALNTAHSIGQTLPGTELAQKMLDYSSRTCGSNKDHSAMIVALEHYSEKPPSHQ